MSAASLQLPAVYRINVFVPPVDVEALKAGICLECCIPRAAQRLQRVLRAVNARHRWEVPAVFVDESQFPLP